MILPEVGREALEAVLDRFDADLRALPEWEAWETRASQKFALVRDGVRYPPKKVVSMATGVPVSQFSGGRQTNRYLEDRGFRIEPIIDGASKDPEVPDFVVGRIYDRWLDINGPYGGARQGGISISEVTSAIFLFITGPEDKDGHHGSIDEDAVLSFTGEGLAGGTQLTGGNLAITNHARDGRALHVFASLGKGEGQQYIGEFTYVNHSVQRGGDRPGSDRQVIVFHLVPVEDEAGKDSPDGVDAHQRTTSMPNLAEARNRALAAFGAHEGSGGKQARKILYHRSRAVRDYVLLRSRGNCESCHQPAPFQRVDGSPYLEPHHTTKVSDGGLDHPRFVGAICPTCHREIHHGQDGKQRNAKLVRYLAGIEPHD